MVVAVQDMKQEPDDHTATVLPSPPTTACSPTDDVMAATAVLKLPPELWSRTFCFASHIEDLAHLWVEGRRVSHVFRTLIEDLFASQWISMVKLGFNPDETNNANAASQTRRISFAFHRMSAINPSYAIFKPNLHQRRHNCQLDTPRPPAAESTLHGHYAFTHCHLMAQSKQSDRNGNLQDPEECAGTTKDYPHLVRRLREAFVSPWCHTRPRHHISFAGSVNDTPLTDVQVNEENGELSVDWKELFNGFLGEEREVTMLTDHTLTASLTSKPIELTTDASIRSHHSNNNSIGRPPTAEPLPSQTEPHAQTPSHSPLSKSRDLARMRRVRRLLLTHERDKETVYWLLNGDEEAAIRELRELRRHEETR